MPPSLRQPERPSAETHASATDRPANVVAEPVDWSDAQGPRSARYGDVYRSRAGGLAQANGVFLRGCGLPDAWRGRLRFTVLETGFGLGLNFLATWAAWRTDSHRPSELHYVSVEAHPVEAGDLLRSIASLGPATGGETGGADPHQLQTLASELASRWQELRPGTCHFDFEAGRVRLTLAVGDAREVLDRLPPASADAVYLDGFSPSLNPAMWSSVTLESVARHCVPGTRLATFTVARPVRDRLALLGFSVRRRPGLPPKWHRLEAEFLRAPTQRT